VKRAFTQGIAVIGLALLHMLAAGCDDERYHRVTTRAIISWDGRQYNLGWDLSTPKGVEMRSDQSGVLVVDNVVQVAVENEYVGGQGEIEGRKKWFILRPNTSANGPPALRGQDYQLIEFPSQEAWRDAWKTLGLKSTLSKPKA
jgi:hypothetical protein